MGLWKRRPESTHEPITASAGAVTRQKLMSATAKPPNTYEAWQEEIDIYDEWGPGFVGAYLDLISDKTSKCDALLVDERNGQVVDDDKLQNIFAGVWSLWRGEYSTREELLFRHVRFKAKHGECYVLHLPSGKIAIAHKSELQWEPVRGVVKYRDPVTEKLIEVSLEEDGPIPHVWRSWVPFDKDPRRAQADLKRALPHIREYINVKLRQDTDTTSPLVRNKIMLFDDQVERYKNADNELDPRNGMPDAFVDYLELARKAEAKPYHSARRPVDTVPFPMLGEKLSLLDLGRNGDPASAALEEAAIFAFARSIRVPLQYIHSGPGVAKYENEAYVLESLIQDAVEPLSISVLHDIWRVWARPLMIIAVARFRDINLDEAAFVLRHYNMGPDANRIRPKIDNVKNLAQGWKDGVSTREAYAEALDTQMMELPADVDEFELWKLVNKIPAEPPAGAGPVAPPPGTAPAAAPAGGGPAGVIDGIDTSTIPPPPPDLKATPELMASASPPPKVDRSPLALIAAASDPLKDILDLANRTDELLFTSLLARSQEEYARLVDEAARTLSRIAPSGSDLKLRLSAAATSAAKLAVVTPADVEQYAITPEMLVPQSATRQLAIRAEEDFKHALEAFIVAGLAAGVFADGVVPAYDYAAGGQRLADGVREYTRYRVLTPGGAGGAPDGLADIPVHHVRDAMAVAGGAPESDTTWGPPTGPAANTPGMAAPKVTPGAAAGSSTIDGVRAHDPAAADEIFYEWRHAYYRTPKVPDEVHLALNGFQVPMENGVIRADLLGDRYPGDHHNCTCAWVLVTADMAMNNE